MNFCSMFSASIGFDVPNFVEMRFALGAVLLSFCLICPAQVETGHSKHGSAFDSGMRTRPWEMKGIGSAPLPITSSNPEVQKWFDQGNALLHSFWFEEAERSFRWCLKLDPDCAMAYWSLARCGFNWFSMGSPNFDAKDFDRYKVFLKEAVKRQDKVSERERLYIEAWNLATYPGTKNPLKTLNSQLQKLVLKYPKEIEAKALLALFNIGQGSAYTNQLLIDEVLKVNPMHPGAHHASIHNWDGLASDQAIRSCELYGKSAPNIGHSLHMPGHIYSKIGMWHEAAIAMDSATRIELSYMNDRLALPFETWNYPHNRNYLCYIQEQLGMAEAALQGAKDMLKAPQDPEYNPGAEGPISMQGQIALIRGLIKFEKWDQILTPGVIPWDDKSEFTKSMKPFVECLALVGLNKTKDAREKYEDLRAQVQKQMNGKPADSPEFQGMNAELNLIDGLICLGEGKQIDGLRSLLNAADADTKDRQGDAFINDPPNQPWPIMRILGDVYRKRGENQLAIECYEKSLAQEPNDAFSLSGLALTTFATGNMELATTYAGRLEYVWSQADPNLKWMSEVRKLHLNAKPIAVTPEHERLYKPSDLDKLGPMNWQPFMAPALQVTDTEGKPAQLSDYLGKNVLLVFFLGDACVHCVGQLKSINDRGSDFAAQDTVILAVCSATPEKLKESKTLENISVNFLSDKDHFNARKFSSYDDFEEMELHSTILIDKTGKVRWKRTGGDPFMNMDFLIGELKRVNGQK